MKKLFISIILCGWMFVSSSYSQINRTGNQIPSNMVLSRPTSEYLTKFEFAKEHTLGVYGTNFKGKEEIYAGGIERGWGINAWFAEPDENGKTYKECVCGRLTNFSQYIFVDDLGNWDDYDINFKVSEIGNNSPFNSLFKMGPIPRSISDQVQNIIKLIRNARVPVNGGFELVSDVTWTSSTDQHGNNRMGWEIDVSPIVYNELRKLQMPNNIFDDFKFRTRKICGYGPYVRDILHPLGVGHPELHPVEQIWFREDMSGKDGKYGTWRLGLFNDRTGRFTKGGDKPLHSIPLEGTFAISFETSKIDPLKFEISPTINHFAQSNYNDGKSHFLIYRGDTIVSVFEKYNKQNIDFFDIQFKDVTLDSEGIYRGYIVINSKVGGKGSVNDFLSRNQFDKLPPAPLAQQSPSSYHPEYLRLLSLKEFEGILNPIFDLYDQDSVLFSGGLMAFVEKSSLRKTKIDFRLEQIERIEMNSYRGVDNSFHEPFVIHFPTQLPSTFDQEKIEIDVIGMGIQKRQIIPKLKVGENKSLDGFYFSKEDVFSKKHSFQVNLYANGINLGSQNISVDPGFCDGTLKTLPIYLVWQRPILKNPNEIISTEGRDELSIIETQQEHVNLFKIGFRCNVYQSSILNTIVN